MIIKVDFDFFKTPAGAEFELIPQSYQLNVCDCCGRKRKCDLYQSVDGGTFVDLCRSCFKDHAEVVKDAAD